MGKLAKIALSLILIGAVGTVLTRQHAEAGEQVYQEIDIHDLIENEQLTKIDFEYEVDPGKHVNNLRFLRDEEDRSFIRLVGRQVSGEENSISVDVREDILELPTEDYIQPTLVIELHQSNESFLQFLESDMELQIHFTDKHYRQVMEGFIANK